MIPLRLVMPGALLVLGLACAEAEGPDEGPRAAVERGRIERIVVATGTIEPETEIEVRPRISGIVEKVWVKAGDAVRAGQPLVEIDRELLEAQAREVASRLAGSQVELRYGRRELERAQGLRSKGAASEQTLENAQARHEAAQAAVEREQAAVESLSVQLGYTTVSAAMAGTILEVDVEEGDAVSAVTAVTGGTRLLTIADANLLHLEGLVDENEIARVALGQPARVRTEAFGERVFEGRVREIAPHGQRQQNVTYFEVEVLITDPSATELRARMSADAEIVSEVVENALFVPETALLYEGDVVYVELASNGSSPPERRPVRIGIIDADRVQILEGLREGEEVRLR